MIDVNNTNSLLHPKIIGQSIEDSEHLRATNSNFANRKPTTNNEYLSNDDDYEYCPNCSRKFFVGRLTLHLKSCKEGKPLKPVKTTRSQNKIPSLTETNNENQNLAANSGEKTPELDKKRENTAINFQRQSSLAERSEELVSKYLQSALMQSNMEPNQESQHTGNQNKTPTSYGYGDYNFQAKETKSQFAEDEEPAQDNNQQEYNEEERQQDMADQGERIPCSICGRKFAEDRLAKHENACAKSNKKRKAFDMSKQRATDEMAQVQSQAPKGKKVPPSAVKEVPKESAEEKPLKKLPAWKVEHENFIKNIRFNRKVKAMEEAGEDTSNLVAPTIVNENYVQCPHCTRKFAPNTAERHIPKCKNTFNRPKPPKALNLDKVEDGQRVDRGKVNYILKKGVNSKISPSENEKRNQVGSTNDVASTENTTASYRSPHSAVSSRNGNSAQEEAKDKTPKGQSKPPTASKVKLVKQYSNEIQNKRAATAEKAVNEDASPTELAAYEVKFEKKTSHRDPSPGERRVFIEAMPKKEELLKNYTSLYNRANTGATQECPHCARKFNPQAAQRHIPICQDLKTRPLKKVNDRTNSKDENQKTDMKTTFNGTKFGFRRQPGESEEGTQARVNPAGGTTYGGFLSKQGSRNGERPPLPSSKGANAGLLGTCEPIIEKAGMNKTKMGFGGSANNFCTSCGTKAVRGHKFCGNCGNKKK